MRFANSFVMVALQVMAAKRCCVASSFFAKVSFRPKFGGEDTGLKMNYAKRQIYSVLEE